ncbi:MAG: class I SAM-dependent rRNA methyltransferase [Planctomycetes bacterium]|nr:class I SAM-dependent rRNA methyltransferase [Planctomycetota bacterium]
MSADSPAPPPAVRLTKKASGLARRGQLWFFTDDIAEPAGSPGQLIRVRDDGGRDLGLAFLAAAKVALRLCGPWPGHDIPDRETFFAARLAAALQHRPELSVADAGVRLVHGEGDGLPGLIVDRYGPVLVLQVTSAAVENALDAIVPFLVARTGAESVVARNDIPARRHENLRPEVSLLHGRRIEETVISEHGVRHPIRPFDGHKTGFYLDQRPARALVRQLASGRTVLDLFAYQGAFSLSALAGGASAALAVDESVPALDRARAAATANRLEGLSTESANVFDFLRAERDRDARHGLIMLDPPAFARSRRELAGAERGYRDLNRLALRVLEPGGHLLTCSCSHHVSLPHFEDIVRQAAAGLPFRTVLLQRLGAGPDHPCQITHPQSEYLKVLLLQRRD